MSGISKKLMGTTAAAGGGFTAIEDVFSTYLYTGNGSTQTITNGIDLAGEGGLVWIKGRPTSLTGHVLTDAVRGATKQLQTHTASAEETVANGLTSFLSDGFSIGSDANYSRNGDSFASWTFRKAPRFFDVVTYTGDGTYPKTILHNLGSSPGSVIIKKYSASDNWSVFHRGLPSGICGTGRLYLNGTNSTENSTLSFFTPTNTSLTLPSNTGLNDTGVQYVAYLYAHDPLGPSEDGSDGLISCGSFSLSGGTGSVNLGWEPQFVLVKQSDGTGNWYIHDTMRGMALKADASLSPNTSSAESTYVSAIIPNATGFVANGGYFPLSGNYIYIAIRRGPMRVPESGTEVFNAIIRNGTGNAATVTGVGFAPELVVAKNRAETVTSVFYDKLRGVGRVLASSFTSAELIEATSDGITSFNNDGVSLREDNDQYGGINNSIGTSYVNYFFRRAPNFFDVVAYTGTGVEGDELPHNLGVTPEMIIQKSRDDINNWLVSVSGIPAFDRLLLNSSGATASTGNTNYGVAVATSTTFRQGPYSDSGEKYIAYLFATLAGVSKVGSYTGNGSFQNIDCGFTTGARFVLIKRTDGAGSWHVFDTARGIVAGNDPVLLLNSTAAEDAFGSSDNVDPYPAGFGVWAGGYTLNNSGENYIFYAIA